MAGINAVATTPKITISATSTTYYVASITAPTNQRLKIKRFGVFFNEETGDATPAIPFEVYLGNATTPTGGSALTPVKLSSGSETLQASALYSLTSATVDKRDYAFVNGQTFYEVFYAPGDEVIVQGGETFGIVVISGATISTGNLSVVAKIYYEE